MVRTEKWGAMRDMVWFEITVLQSGIRCAARSAGVI